MSKELLTQADIAALVDGDEIYVLWVGGNGPHKYTVKWYGTRCYADTETMKEYNELTNVGSRKSNTRVQLA